MLNFSAIDRATLLGRAIRWPLALVPARARLPILQGPLKGFRWVAGSSTHGCWLGSYERDQQRVFERVVGVDDVVFDVGAHAGFYTLLSSVLVGPAGRVVAFEPVPANLERLRTHLEINAVGNVEIVEAAVGDVRGELRLSRGPSDAMWRTDPAGTLTVESVVLDELVTGGALPPPAVMKFDIEGAELLALRGSARIMERFHPTIILSTHGPDVHRACCELLQARGYGLSPIGRTSIEDCAELLAVRSDLSC